MSVPNDLERRTYWLSFCDPDKPEGSQHLGCCLVEVDEFEAALAKAQLPRYDRKPQPGAEWIAAACTKAWSRGCNPGGEVAAFHMKQRPAGAPLDRLLQRGELEELGLIATNIEDLTS